MIVLALFIAVVPPLVFGLNWYSWIYEALVILVIACPCALVISTPISIISSLACAARNGVLIKGGTFIEIPAKLKVIAFDKTGTLTQGTPSTREIITNDGFTEDELISVAASLEKNIDHPIAQAILKYAKDNDASIKDIDNAEVITGRGVTGTIGGQEYWLGSHIFAHERELCENVDIHNRVLAFEKRGYTIIFVGNDNKQIGIIAIQDSLKKDISIALSNLKQVGIEKNVMLTGDNKGTATTIASQSGIDDFYAELLPEDKVNKIEELVNKYEYVAMVGDGINDAPALARSNLGIAMGAIGNDIAIETADIALMSDDINKLPWLINHSKRTMKIIKQNIGFSISVKAVFISLAIAGLATLWMAIAADIGATFLVIMNALRLLKTKD
jgi:Cd2+/Zn2+-exporting ATPase